MQMIMFKMSDEYYLISAKSVEEIIDTVPIYSYCGQLLK